MGTRRKGKGRSLGKKYNSLAKGRKKRGFPFLWGSKKRTQLTFRQRYLQNSLKKEPLKIAKEKKKKLGMKFPSQEKRGEESIRKYHPPE